MINDHLIILLSGFLLGFFTSIPVAGPISVLVVVLGMENRYRTAIGVAAGGALGEALYAFLAFWGFSRYLSRYPLMDEASRCVTAIILLTVGIFLIRKRDPRSPKARNFTEKGASRNGMLIGLGISLLNPTLILTWTAASSVFFSIHIVSFHQNEAFAFAGGVGAGIVGWFSLLLGIVGRTRDRFHPSSIDRLLFWMGWVVVVAAVFIFVLFLRDLPA